VLTLRPYQRAALDALYAYWRGDAKNALIVLPTGAGKSLVLAELCRELLKDWPTLRIGIVTHVKELIGQNYQELIKIWPQAPAGIYSAGIGRRDARAQILFCGIQSVWNKSQQVGAFDLLLIDEAHLIGRSASSMYGKFFEAQRNLTGDMKIVGLTATAFRLDSGRLDQGKDRLFDRIVYDAAVTDLIEQGYLSPLISKATVQQLSTDGVAKRGGEFVPGQLEIAVNKDWITRAAAEEMVRYGADRKKWLAFCVGVKHAGDVRDALRALNVSSETVTGETPKGERDRLIREFKAGSIRCLTSVGVLGTGFNVPSVDLIALLRPTESAGLFCQQVGRGLRKAEGKTDCLVLDFAGLTKRHGPIDQITIESGSKAKDDKDAPLAKECPQCFTLVALAARRCPTCGHEWPERLEPKHDAVADATTSIISKGAAVWVDVDQVRYYWHEKPGSQPSIRVEYSCGFTIHREWVCLSHQGFARQKAEQWWLRCGERPLPASSADGFKRIGELKAPAQIQVRPSGKYFEVCGRRFECAEVAA
jgi:DNA repair protein RadD